MYPNVIGMDTSQSGDQHIYLRHHSDLHFSKKKKSPERYTMSLKYMLTCSVHFEYTQITKDPSMQ